MKVSRGLAVLAAGSALAGCVKHRTIQVDPDAVGVTWGGTIQPFTASGTRLKGVARVGPGSKANESHVVIKLEGGTMQGRHPWVIRSGNCGELVTVDLGNRAMYPPLSLRGDGTADLSFDLPIVVPIDQPYSLNIFASAADRDLVVACGRLSPTG